MDHPLGLLPHGRTLRIRLASPGVVHWTVNQWDDVQDVPTSESASNVHTVDLPTASLPPGTRLQFTFYWPKVRRWEVQDFEIQIEGAERGARAAGEAGAGYFRR
jgi:glucoamylase